MKIKLAAFSLFLCIAFYSCDKIEGPYRKPVVVNEFCKTGIEDSTVHRKVLAEEFTGHFCGNCPNASIYLDDTLKALYSHCLVVISIHAGFFAAICPNAPCPGNQPPNSFKNDLSSTVGNDWFNFFGQPNNPMAMINRIDYPTLTVKGTTSWAQAIATQLTTKAAAKVKISNTYSTLTRDVSVNVSTDLLENLTGTYKLQVVLTEDSIIDWQEWYSHPILYDSTYAHRHVLRDAINTSWGETIVSGSATAGTTISKNYLYTINSKWNADYCSIVAFIYNDVTKEVIQVEEASVR